MRASGLTAEQIAAAELAAAGLDPTTVDAALLARTARVLTARPVKEAS